jgi:hypothetical protein
MTTDPILCDDCRHKWNKDLPLVIEVKWVYKAHNGCYCYCIHAFNTIKLTETNLEMLERKYEENPSV